MPRGVSSTIITELDKSAFESPIYAVRITRETGTLYWAEREVTIDGQAYEARLDSHDGVDFVPGVASSYTIRALNIDGGVTALDRAESFAGCRCELLEYLPTLNLYSRRATGYLDEITEITQEIATIPVTTEHTGNTLVSIPKRTVSASCPHHFANTSNYVNERDFEGSECPYQRVDTIGFGATLLDNLDAVSDPVTFLVSWDGGIDLAGAKFKATDQIRIDSEVMLVTAADDVDGNGDQEITVSRGYGSTSLTVHSVSPATFVYFANCQFSDSACIRRGMYGNNPYDTFGGTPRNYFGGFPIITGTQWGYYRTKQGEKPSPQRLNFSGNESAYGMALCLPYGKVRIADPILLLAVGEGDFLTTFWAVSEGLLATNDTDDTQTTRINAYSGGGTGIYVNNVSRHDSRPGFGIEQWNGQMDQEPPSSIWFQDYPEDFEDFFLGFNGTAWLVLRINTKTNPAVDVTGQQITGAFDVEYGRIVRVYSSVSPVTYTRKSTTNPAWIGLDIRTAKRVGAGVDYGRMDIQSYIDSASHNDELINSTDEDAVTSPATMVKRWTFNGAFDQKRPFGEWERMLFLGCHTIPPFPGSDGKYKIKPLKAESLVGVPVLSSIVASNARNILWEAGEAGVERSSLVKIRKSLIEIPNQVTATFVDKATYTKITVTVADRDAQEALGRKLGDQSRRTIERQYSLPGTSTLEEAARWATLTLRIGEFAQGGLANNNGVRGKLFYRGAVNLEIGDIVDLHDDQLDTLNGERYYRISRLSDQATQVNEGGFLYEREFEAWVHDNEMYDDGAFTVTHFERLESNLGDDDLMNGPTPTVNNISGTEFDVHFEVPSEDAETYFEYSVYGHTSGTLPTAITDETGTEGVVIAGISKLTDLSKSWTPNEWATTYDIVLFDTHRGSLSPLTRTFDYEGMFIVCQIVSNTENDITFNAPGSQVRWTMSGIEYYIVERGVGHHFWEQLAFTTPAIVDESVTVRDPSQVPGTMNRSVRLSASLSDFYVWVACYNKFGQGRVTATPAYVTYGGTASGQVDVLSIVDGRDLGGLINARQLMASSGGRFATIRPSLVNGRAQFADTTTGGFRSFDPGWTANVIDDRFGASGDGITDDTAAIQAAVDSITAENGGTILFPAGRYKVSATIQMTSGIGYCFRGMGPRASVIEPTVALAGSPSANPVFKFSDCREFVIEKLWIKGNSSNPPTAAIEFSTIGSPIVAATQNTVRHCLIGSEIAHSLVNGIKWTDGGLDANNDSSIIDCVEFVNCITAGLSIQHSNSLNHRFNNLTMDLTNETAAVGVRLAGGSFTMYGGQLSVASGGWDFDFAAGTYRYPIKIIGTDSEASAGILRTATSNDIWVTMTAYHRQGAPPPSSPAAANETVIDFNSANGRFFAQSSIFNLGQVNTWDFSGSAAYASFVGCSLNPTFVTWENDLVWIANHVLTGTVTFTPGGSAKMLELGSSNTEMEVGYARGLQRVFGSQTLDIDNRLSLSTGADVASGTTITLGNDGNSFVITGTTTIDNIVSSNWTAGSVITLVFTSTVTVRHNQAAAGTPILLSGGLSMVATADDSLTLLLITSPSQAALRWIEISRSVI